MKIIVTGCKGQLGTEILKQLREGRSEIGPIPEKLQSATVIAVDLPDLDISNYKMVDEFIRRNRPDVIINCAAYTNVDGCEVNHDAAFKANAIGPRNLAQAAEKIGARLVHVSTDYVFSGRENGGIPQDEATLPGPISAYGSTKLMGEKYVEQFCHRHFIVRTAWLYSYYGKNFVKTIVNAGKKFGKLEVVNDQCGNPTNAVDLAHEILQLCVTHEYGLYHCTGEGICSWYDFASEIIKQLREGRSEIGPIPEKLQSATVIPVDLPELDISNYKMVDDFIRRQRPDVIINCAAYTNVDGCEVNHDAAFKANALGPRNLAQAATKTGARLVHVSTDYVFSGRENGGIAQDEATIPGPISAYGSTKLMGEKYVEQFCHRHFIVRTAWLYSYYGKNFVKTIVNAGKKFGKLEVVNDQCGNPTNAVDLAHEILQLCVTHEYGLYHCTGEGICSWYDFASEIIRLSGVDAAVAPCTSEEYKAKHPESADRPKWSALDNRMLRCTVGNEVRDWKAALACFFEHWDGENGMK